MNKLLIGIGFLMLILCMSCAISKKENERMDQILSQQATPPEITILDTLTSDMLRNYEIRAVQKLEEFYDYFNLLSNETYGELMKSEIRTSAMGLFFDLGVHINPVDSKPEDEKALEMYLIDHQEATFAIDLAVSSIEMVTPLQKSSTDLYEGQLSFQLSKGEDGDQKSISKSALFSLRKIEKTIGEESVKIWEVFLERIE